MTLPTGQLEERIQAMLRTEPTTVDPAVAARLAATALRQGQRRKVARVASMTALPAAVAVSVALAATLPGAGTRGPASPGPDARGPAVVAPTSPPSAHDLLLAASSRLLATPAADGAVYWVKTSYVLHPDAQDKSYVTESSPLPPLTVTTETASSRTVRQTTSVFADGSVQRQRYPFPRTPFTFGVGGLTWDQMRGLPADPNQLRALVVKRFPQAIQASIVESAVADLFLAPTTPAVRAAGYRLLATMPGVTAVGAVRDPLGRVGQGFEATLVIPSLGSGPAPEPVTRRLIIGGNGQLLADIGLVGPGHTALHDSTTIIGSGYRDAL